MSNNKKYVISFNIKNEPTLYYVGMLSKTNVEVRRNISQAKVFTKENVDGMIKKLKPWLGGNGTITKVLVD